MIMKLIFAISIVALSFFGTACRRSVGEMILVPMPQEATFTGGYFETDSARFVERAGDGYVACRIDPSAPEIRPEGYRLKVTRRGIDLTALDSAGLFYGRQTLCLLATAQGIPCVEIIDNPCFGYRGIHLDVSRHFFPVETIFRLLDEMARYKLNKFHFHLADNGGWRIRIDAYPLLTRLGAPVRGALSTARKLPKPMRVTESPIVTADMISSKTLTTTRSASALEMLLRAAMRSTRSKRFI